MNSANQFDETAKNNKIAERWGERTHPTLRWLSHPQGVRHTALSSPPNLGPHPKDAGDLTKYFGCLPDLVCTCGTQVSIIPIINNYVPVIVGFRLMR